MSGQRNTLTVGTKFQIDGDYFTVLSFSGSSITARSARGKLVHFDLSTLFNTSGFTLGETLEVSTNIPVEGVPDEALKSAKELAEHILEAVTGYRRGSSDDACEDEPKREYDPEWFNLTQRLAHKAKELGKKDRILWALKQRYEKFGVMGLVDQRAIRQTGMKVDARVRHALGALIAEYENLSNPTKKELYRKIEIKIRDLYPEASISLPSETTFSRLIDQVAKGKQLFGSAKQRRSNASRPETPYSQFHASRPGELIVIDSTPLDAFAMDPYTYKWVQLQLTIAIDIYSRSVMAWRFTPVSTKGVDAAFLLYDILRVKPLRPEWGEDLRWAYAGVPENLIIEAGGDPEHPLKAAALPFLHPESVLVDRGSIFLSETFMAACRTLGINLMIARPHTPTDKSHVESFFKTIRENFVATLEGYKGPDVHSRGLDVEANAYWFIDEIEEEFAKWVCTWFQNRTHAGLELPHVPTLRISPNNMFEEGISRAGFVYAPPSADLFYFLLPTAWRTIQHYGVEIDLRYDGEILNDFRNRSSNYAGKYQGKWPFKYDPRDRSKIYFMDPSTSVWHALYWRGPDQNFRPFSAKTLSYAKGLVIAQQLDPSSYGDLTHVLNKLLNRIDERQMLGKKERRVAALQLMDTSNAAKDRALAPASLLPPLMPLSSESSDESAEANTISELSFDEQAASNRHIKDGAFRTTEEADEDEDDDLAI